MPKTPSTSTGGRKSSDKVKRPPNCFMLYRKAKLKELQAVAGGEHGPQMSVASKVIGRLWEEESAEVRQYFTGEAARMALEHAQLHPGYKYKPRPHEVVVQEREARLLARQEKRAAGRVSKRREASSSSSASDSSWVLGTPQAAHTDAQYAAPPGGLELGPFSATPMQLPPGHPVAALSLTGPPLRMPDPYTASLHHHLGYFAPDPLHAAIPQHYPPAQPYLLTPALDARFGVFNAVPYPTLPSFDGHLPWVTNHAPGHHIAAVPHPPPQDPFFQDPLASNAADASLGVPFAPEGPLALPDVPADWVMPPFEGVDLPEIAAPEIAAPLPRWPASYHPTYLQPEEHHPTPDSSSSSSLSSPVEGNSMGLVWGAPEKFDFSESESTFDSMM
ncbi:hypothetical protein PYCCODRAFT_1426020 [Trametes coccinea BRFM310]|uniref:HMG box domain-containing protein n=1 Tax=Trametes coccinea (strain BRFM310) TaxID=1353009 RepID=A0A1Y2IKY3_TRAC3|nr:hypothetical protein PYCCODRAFT_1426020 [Trametes coccinea BRFM310]